MLFLKKILKFGSILISSVFNSNVFLFKLQQPKFFFTIFFWFKNLSFSPHSILAACLISTTVSNPISLTGCLPPQVNSEVGRLRLLVAAAHHRAATSYGRPSTQEPRAVSHAPFPL
jgi:hypothetical protein